MDLQSELQQVHQRLLELLLTFDRICAKHQIQYQLAAGTLLGAVRHQGFIPWDDDIDVCMLRSDYERFLKVAPAELDNSLVLDQQHKPSGMRRGFTKLAQRDIHAEAQDAQHEPLYFIDIFPFDFINPDNLSQTFWLGLFLRCRDLNLSLAEPATEHQAKAQRTRIGNAVAFVAFGIGKLLGQSGLNLLSQFLFQRASLHQCSPWVCCLVMAPTITSIRQKRTRCHEQFVKLCKVSFCGHWFPAPANYHQVLTALYGEYLRLPPVEMRKPTHRPFRSDRAIARS